METRPELLNPAEGPNICGNPMVSGVHKIMKDGARVAVHGRSPVDNISHSGVQQSPCSGSGRSRMKSGIHIF
ncbi:hypothetical protein Mapa_016737 [Marchantia paleacea]|nr:hypothetical protein Mapa_016737 [Marchantia paleacea]